MRAFMRAQSLRRAGHQAAGTSAAAPVATRLPKKDGARAGVGGEASRFAHDFSGAPVWVRPKLAAGGRGDEYEQEAERVSGEVMRAAGPTQPPVRMKSGPAGADGEPVSSPLVDEVLGAPGRPLDAGARAFMEPRFGRVFGHVRVHTDAKAADSARALGALAYTAGRHVVFDAGRYSPHTDEGRHLLAHELAHTIQGASSAPVIRRQPRGGGKKKAAPAKRPDPEVEVEIRPRTNELTILVSEFMYEREVPPHVFKDGKLPPGFTLTGSGGTTITTRWILAAPADTDISSGSVTSLLKEGVAKGLADKLAGQRTRELESMGPIWEVRIQGARERFRRRHDDHTEQALHNIDIALRRATRGNPNLMYAYYEYYSDEVLTDELDEDSKNLGTTSSGETDLNPRLLRLEPVFKTDDPVSLLGGTLIHEFVHTPQGPKDHGIAQAPKEAKAYAVEVFLAERMGDKKRAEVIYNLNSSTDSVGMGTGSGRIFNTTYNVMTALYKIIDSGRSEGQARAGGGLSAEKAREVSVEFITKNEADYGTELKAFVDKHASR